MGIREWLRRAAGKDKRVVELDWSYWAGPLRDTKETQRHVRRWAKRQSLELPKQVGVRFGYPVSLWVARNTARPQGARFAVDVMFDNVLIDTLTFEDAGDAIRAMDRAKVDYATVPAVVYRGQGGKWRIRPGTLTQ